MESLIGGLEDGGGLGDWWESQIIPASRSCSSMTPVNHSEETSSHGLNLEGLLDLEDLFSSKETRMSLDVNPPHNHQEYCLNSERSDLKFIPLSAFFASSLSASSLSSTAQPQQNQQQSYPHKSTTLSSSASSSSPPLSDCIVNFPGSQLIGEDLSIGFANRHQHYHQIAPVSLLRTDHDHSSPQNLNTYQDHSHKGNNDDENNIVPTPSQEQSTEQNLEFTESLELSDLFLCDGSPEEPIYRLNNDNINNSVSLASSSSFPSTAPLLHSTADCVQHGHVGAICDPPPPTHFHHEYNIYNVNPISLNNNIVPNLGLVSSSYQPNWSPSSSLSLVQSQLKPPTVTFTSSAAELSSQQMNNNSSHNTVIPLPSQPPNHDHDHQNISNALFVPFSQSYSLTSQTHHHHYPHQERSLAPVSQNSAEGNSSAQYQNHEQQQVCDPSILMDQYHQSQSQPQEQQFTLSVPFHGRESFFHPTPASASSSTSPMGVTIHIPDNDQHQIHAVVPVSIPESNQDSIDTKLSPTILPPSDIEKTHHIDDNNNDEDENCQNTTQPKALYNLKKKRSRNPKNKITVDASGQITTHDGQFPCPLKGCFCRFKTAEHRAIHERCHAQNHTSHVTGKIITTTKTPYICCYCDKGMKLWTTLKRHLYKEHAIDLGLHKCGHCAFAHTEMNKILAHQMTHGEERNFLCDQCESSYKNRRQLWNHIRRIHLGKDARKKIFCGDCGLEFMGVSNYNKHVKQVHLKSERYRCEKCSYTTFVKNDYSKHMERVHPQDPTKKRFSCKRCTFSTLALDVFRRHEQTHKENKVLKCSYCNYSATQAKQILAHFKACHFEESLRDRKLLICVECAFETTIQQKFTAHCRSRKHLDIVHSCPNQIHDHYHPHPASDGASTSGEATSSYASIPSVSPSSLSGSQSPTTEELSPFLVPINIHLHHDNHHQHNNLDHTHGTHPLSSQEMDLTYCQSWVQNQHVDQHS